MSVYCANRGPAEAQVVMETNQDMGGAQQRRSCVTCGREIDWQMNVCPYCGHDYRYFSGPASKPRTIKPIIGGALIIIAGILAISMGIMLILMGASDLEDWGFGPTSEGDLSLSEMESVLNACGAGWIVCGAIAIVGGGFAVMRKGFGLSIVGGILGILGLGFVVGSALGLVGLILVVMSRSEF